jgi:hypothetical protein
VNIEGLDVFGAKPEFNLLAIVAICVLEREDLKNVV